MVSRYYCWLKIDVERECEEKDKKVEKAQLDLAAAAPSKHPTTLMWVAQTTRPKWPTVANTGQVVWATLTSRRSSWRGAAAETSPFFPLSSLFLFQRQYVSFSCERAAKLKWFWGELEQLIFVCLKWKDDYEKLINFPLEQFTAILGVDVQVGSSF